MIDLSNLRLTDKDIKEIELADFLYRSIDLGSHLQDKMKMIL